MAPEEQTNQSQRSGNQRDGDLLRQYAEARSEAAFTELVRRYAGLVYTTCLRELGDRTLAEDASQSVFLLLSQKANTLQRSETIVGWLYTAARYVAKNLMKQERRRYMNEARATSALTTEVADNALWESIEPHLHDSLDRLKPADREAILLRFVSEQSFAEVGIRLGLAENTVRMRVSRALEKIRTHLAKAGIAVSIGLLATVLEERAAQAAPMPLLQSLTQLAAPQLTVIGGSSTLTAPSPPTIGRIYTGFNPFHLRIVCVLGSGVALCIIGFFLYWQTLPHPLSATQQRQLFASLVGSWQGTLEYADDATQQHFTYPTTVTFRMQNQGSRLEYVAAYQGSTSVDTTTLTSDPNTGSVTVQNGGTQSSHRLSGVGRLLALHNGGYAFEGFSVAMNADVRLRIQLRGHQLTLQEEYRKPDQTRYQFRNRFDLSGQ